MHEHFQTAIPTLGKNVYICTALVSAHGGIKRESGENPGHFPML